MKRMLAAVGIAAVVIILLLVFYRFYPGGAPAVGPSPSKPPAVALEPPATPAPQEKPGPTGAIEPVPPGPAAAQLPKPAGPEEVVRQPEARPPTVLPPLEPQKKDALLFKSYRKYQDAEKMLMKLKKQGEPAFIQRNGRRKVYEVWVGPFPSRDQARAAAKRLKSRFKITPKLQTMTIPVPK